MSQGLGESYALEPVWPAPILPLKGGSSVPLSSGLFFLGAEECEV